jgi:exonuclease III
MPKHCLKPSEGMLMELKIVTWNMAYWSHKKFVNQAWAYFFEKIDADIYLFQESYPSEYWKNSDNFLWFGIGGTRNWGTGIYSKKYPLEHLEIKNNHIGSLVLAEVKVTDEWKLTVISLYGSMEKLGNTVYAITTLHRMLSDLTGVLNGHFGGRRQIILGGDFNASIQCDLYWGGEAHSIFFSV